MNVLWISWKNIRRRKGRTILIAFGLVAGITLLVTLLAVSKALRDDIDILLDEYGANIIITAKPSTLPLSYGSVTVHGFTDQPGELDESDLIKIKQIRNKETINAIAPKLLVPADVGQLKTLLVGVRFADEFRIKKWWKFSGRRPSKPHEVILGNKAAQRLGKKIGDGLTIKNRKFTVAAVLNKLGTQEDDLIYSDLATTQRLYNKPGKLTMIELAAWCQTCPIERVVAQVGAKLPRAKVSSFKQAVAAKKNTIKIIDRFTIAIAVIIFAAGTLAIASTTLSSVNQRIKEIGILRAIGYRKNQVARIVLCEAFLISSASGLLGWATGTGLAKLVAARMAGPRVAVPWSPITIAGTFGTSLHSPLRLYAGHFDITVVPAVGLAILLGLLAGLYPARRAASFEPHEALRAF